MLTEDGVPWEMDRTTLETVAFAISSSLRARSDVVGAMRARDLGEVGSLRPETETTVAMDVNT